MRVAGRFEEPIRGAIRRPDATTLRFLVTGCSAALLFFSLSYLFVRAGLAPFTGILGAYVLCFVTAYLTQRAWTFRGAHRHRDALPRYLAAQVGCGLLSAALARLLADVGLPPLPMAATVTIISSGASYALSRYWVFAAARRAAPVLP